jgi:hypothetical protein
MIQHTTSTSIVPLEGMPLPRRALTICHSERSEEAAFSLGAYCGGSSGSAARCEAAGGVEVLTGDFPGGVLGFAQPEHPAAGDALLELVFPATRYLRIFSSRFGPSPRMASKSSTLLNAPYDFRICNILSAVAGPIPGTSCSSSEVAALIFTGVAGSFFLANAHGQMSRQRIKGMRDANDRHAMARL